MKTYEINGLSLQPKRSKGHIYVEWGVCGYDSQLCRDRWTRWNRKHCERSDSSGCYYLSSQADGASIRRFIASEKLAKVNP